MNQPSLISETVLTLSDDIFNLKPLESDIGISLIGDVFYNSTSIVVLDKQDLTNILMEFPSLEVMWTVDSSPYNYFFCVISFINSDLKDIILEANF